MIAALTKGQEEEDRAKEDNKKELPATSTSKEGKLQKKVGKKVVPSFPKIKPLRHEDQRFTPLNPGVNEVFMEIRRDLAFRWPNKLWGDPRKRDRTKFCEYHNDHGHLTEDCVTLRQEIETFIRNGRLVRFLAGESNRDAIHQQPLLLDANRDVGRQELRCDRDNDPRVDSRAPRDQGVVGEIHTIFGGIVGGGQSNSARKAYARKMQTEEVLSVQRPSKVAWKDSMILSFSEEDARG
ncbi:uncharacterized protein LOC132167523 [Corylus avellana]|uniref:uncharacterized protein LOC132167523 n=1 Tax=Corylus avellana TaxID=13451 RepID=UPI00286BD3A5|nr:uncharacterized protein LOC132167523 [Corylus avellana]